ncbi:MAG: putative glycosyltransferase, exosortase G system-associated [Anaerolineae bacterium]|nr:putative glycosyltransferase, exosortase G system-associated [Anaerolineae bacterium]
MSTTTAYILFWIIWLLVPILVDGITVIASLFGAVFNHRSFHQQQSLDFHPKVSIVIPVRNGAKTLEACIRSIAAQSYPAELLEIMVIDNGSTDDSFQVFNRLTDIRNRITWHSIIGRGKAWALNSGIYLSHSQYFINVDCDLILAPDAVENAIAHMESKPDIGAATGYLVVLPPAKEAASSQKILAELEFFEYVTVFGVGRAYQSQINALFTLSGAFSVFRREILLRTFLYNQDTVSEDTDLTLQLYTQAKEHKIVTIQNAVAYLHPTEDWAKLYSQRVRWQRGELEAAALHQNLVKHSFLRLKGLSLQRTLLIDHTLALPRLIWLVFLPILTHFGYTGSMILFSYLVMYLFYLAVEGIWIAAAWLYAAPAVRQRMLENWFLLPLMPLYRITIFLFRVSGFIYAINEPFSWAVPNPITQLKTALQAQWHSLVQRFTAWRSKEQV